MDRKLQSVAPSVNSGFRSSSRRLSGSITTIQQTEKHWKDLSCLQKKPLLTLKWIGLLDKKDMDILD